MSSSFGTRRRRSSTSQMAAGTQVDDVQVEADVAKAVLLMQSSSRRRRQALVHRYHPQTFRKCPATIERKSLHCTYAFWCRPPARRCP